MGHLRIPALPRNFFSVLCQSMSKALEINGAHKSFDGVEVVKGINFDIEPGEIFGLLGPNGAGKSTTINMIGGVSHIGSGSIRVFGKDVVDDYMDTRRMTGVMHQEVTLDVFFSIAQALRLHSGYYGVPYDEKWANLLIDRLALGPHIHKKTNQLSGGMKRRYMVAKALIHRPKLLILDEPTAGVDVELRRTLWDFVQDVNREGTTILLTTHYLQEAEEVCGRIAIMNKGKIVACEKKEDLLQTFEQKKLRIRVADKISDIPAALTGFTPKKIYGNHGLEFCLDLDCSASTVLDGISNSGLVVSDIETEKPSLEEVFIRFTEEGSLTSEL